MLKNKDRVILDKLDGKEVAKAILAQVDTSKAGPVYAAYRENRRKSGQDWITDRNWEDALVYIIDDLHRLSGHTNSIEICLTYDYINQESLPSKEHTGVLGMVIQDEKEEVMELVAPLQIHMRNNVDFTAARKDFINQNNFPKDIKLKYKTFKTFQFLILIGEKVEIIKLYRGCPLVVPEAVTHENAISYTKSMSEFMLRNTKKKGRMTYEFKPSSGLERVNTYSLARQFMATRCLHLMAKYFDDRFYWDAAKRNIKYNINTFIIDEDDYSFMRESKKAYLGDTSFAAIAILEQDDFKEDEERLFKFTKKAWNEDGSFNIYYDIDEKEFLPMDNQNFAPGQTLLYWIKKIRETPDKDLENKIQKSFEFYSKWHLDPENRHYSFISWQTQAWAELWHHNKDEKLYDFIMEMNDYLADMQIWDDAEYLDRKGSFPNIDGWTCVFMIGMVCALEVAMANNDEKRIKKYRQVILRGIRMLKQLHFTDEADLYYSIRSRRVLGGCKTTVMHNWVRIDNVEHALTAMLFVYDKFGEDFFKGDILTEINETLPSLLPEPRPPSNFSDDYKKELHRIALQALHYSCRHKKQMKEFEFATKHLSQVKRSSFVTLYKNGKQHGCVGTVWPKGNLPTDIVSNTFKACQKDSRFDPLSLNDVDDVTINISVLTKPKRLYFDSEADLIAQLQEGQDGLIIKYRDFQSSLLPNVWKDFKNNKEGFFKALKISAKLSAGFWDADIRVWRYNTEEISGDLLNK